MAKRSIEESTLIAIGDAIREKGGTNAGLDPESEMPAAIRAINTQEDLSPELTTQDGLISQIMTALEGKEAGGGAEVATCTLTLTLAYSSYIGFLQYSKLVDGAIVTTRINEPFLHSQQPFDLENVVCGTIVLFNTTTAAATFEATESEGCEAIHLVSSWVCIQVNSNASSNESVYMWDDD